MDEVLYYSMTGLIPTSALVGTESQEIAAINTGRRGIVLQNWHSTNTIFLAFGVHAAEINKGIALSPNGGCFVMDENMFTSGVINAIATGANTLLTIQEFLNAH